MKLINNKGTTIIEAIVVIVIIVMGVVGMYELLGNSQALSITTKNRIEATQIAREGVESVRNLRDTNWFLFSADYKNCWNTMNYEGNCIGDDGIGPNDPDSDSTTYDIRQGSYKIYKNGENRWILEGTTELGLYSSSVYQDEHRVSLDSQGFYTQDGLVDNLKPLYTREIKISYKETGIDTIPNSDNEIMEIISLVQWADAKSHKIHKVEIKNTISNWKNKKQ